MRARYLYRINVLSLGFCALCAQALFIREMMALFSGTEFIVGMLLSGWLFWVGLGGVVGGRFLARGSDCSYRLFVFLTVLAACLVPATLIAVRCGRIILSPASGELPPPHYALLVSFFAMSPFGFIYGTIYNVASRIWSAEDPGIHTGVSGVYIWEAAGSVAGALIFSFIVLPMLTQLEAGFAVALLVAAVTLLTYPWKRGVWIPVAAVALLAVVFIQAAPRIDGWIYGEVYRGSRVERFLSSKYGEIVAVKKDEILSFFSSGSRIFSVPDRERAENIVHIPLLLHQAPRRVLFIGGSLGGGWEEAAKHRSVEVIDCLELDGRLMELVVEMLDEGGHRGDLPYASIDRPNYLSVDGRFFIKGIRGGYDVIILEAPPPLNLQWNRYYTREFFRMVKESLDEDGIFAFRHPSSENYLSAEQALILRSIRETLGGVFDDIAMIPGSGVHFIAGTREVDIDTMLDRLAERRIELKYINMDYLPFRLSEDRMEYLESALDKVPDAEQNTDMRPTLPLYEILLEGVRVRNPLYGVFRWFLGIPPGALPAVLGIVILLFFVRSRGIRAAKLCVWIVGFGGFLYQLLVLMAYQSYSGLIYHAIVLITAMFMAGVSTGAVCSSRIRPGKVASLRLVHAGYAALSFALLFWVMALGARNIPHSIGMPVFLLLSLSGGFLTGFYYPVVVRSALPDDGKAVPALFYSWDLFGACAGGLIGGAVLFPLTGMAVALVFVSCIHAAAAMLLVGRW